MKLKDAQELVEALRSGEYKQTNGKLGKIINNEEHNCCLGVLCRLKKLERREYGIVVFYGDMYNYPYAPSVSLAHDQGMLVENDMEFKSITLAKLNDDGYTFDEIADILDIYITEGWYKDI